MPEGIGPHSTRGFRPRDISISIYTHKLETIKVGTITVVLIIDQGEFSVNTEVKYFYEDITSKVISRFSPDWGRTAVRQGMFYFNDQLVYLSKVVVQPIEVITLDRESYTLTIAK